MGNMQAAGYAQGVQEGWASLDMALTAHLGGNHFPPIPADFVPVAKQAIEAADAGDWDTEFTMPNDITKTVAEIVEGMHLDAFLGHGDDDWNEDDD